MKPVFPVILTIVLLALSACKGSGQDGASGEAGGAAATAPATIVPAEAEIRAFLVSREGTYGWESAGDPISYDFFPDGRLHIQGPDGEATMWQGSWKLAGNRLTLVCAERSQNETFTVTLAGETLKLGERVYTRSQP